MSDSVKLPAPIAAAVATVKPPLFAAPPKVIQPAWMDKVIFSDDEPEDTFLRVLLYGNMGSGKTHLLGTFPGLFIIDSDHGLLTLKRMGVHYQRFPLGPMDTCFKTVWDILLSIKAKKGPFAPGEKWGDIQTLAIDSSTKLSKFILDESMRSSNKNPMDDKADFTDWGRVRSRLENIGRQTQVLPCNVVVTAMAQVEKNEVTGAFVGGPMLDGKYRDIIGGDFDEVYYLEAVAGKTPTYRCHFRKTQWYDAKSRLGLVEPMDDPSYEKIITTAKALPRKSS